MSDLKTLIEEGQRLLGEAKPEIKSVEVTHDAPEADDPNNHSSHVRYSIGGKEHHYELSTQENPKWGIHHVHQTSPDWEPLKAADGKDEPPIHKQKIPKEDFKTHGGHKVHMLLVKSFTDRLHPVETKRKD